VLMNLKPLEDMRLSKMEDLKIHCYSSRADKLQKHGLTVLLLPWGGNDARDVGLFGTTYKSMIHTVLKYGFSLKGIGQ